MKKLVILFFLSLSAQLAAAQAGRVNMYDAVGYGVILFMLVLFVIVLLVMLRAFRVMAAEVMRLGNFSEEASPVNAVPVTEQLKEKRRNSWLKLLSLKPMSEEKSILIEHDYDGIQELDNPTPAWFMWLFYGTIAFGISYLLIYHVFGVGQLQYDEYTTEMAQADSARKVYLSKAADMVDENTVKLVKDPAVLASGKAIFTQTCSPCHGDHAQGNVGPNLTDDYWLHGNKINDVFKTIKYGVAAKGMPTWEKQLSPKDIAAVANYIKSLHGSNPANAKAPQGDKMADEPQQTAAALK